VTDRLSLDSPFFFRAAVESSFIALLVVDADGTIRYYTPEAARITRNPGAELAHKSLLALLHPDDVTSAKAYLETLAQTDPGRSMSFAARCVLTDSEVRWVDFSGVNRLDDPEIEGIVLTLSDRAEQLTAENALWRAASEEHCRRAAIALQELTQKAKRDQLTGLPNRNSFEERLALEVERSQQLGRPLALALLDIDHFKEVNDLHGHLTGDRALVEVAERLFRTVRDGELLARYGGDEFAWILPGATIEDAWQAAECALHAVKATELPGIGALTVSIGVTQMADGQGPTELFGDADAALYQAKRQGRDPTVCHGDEGEPRRGSATTGPTTSDRRAGT